MMMFAELVCREDICSLRIVSCLVKFDVPRSGWLGVLVIASHRRSIVSGGWKRRVSIEL
jgi:hypothetical protein